jgi:hypothetical protein
MKRLRAKAGKIIQVSSVPWSDCPCSLFEFSL